MLIHNVQPVEQILAAARLTFFKVAVGGGEDAGVGLQFCIRADAIEATVLRDAEQFGLERRTCRRFHQENCPSFALLNNRSAAQPRQ